MNILKHYPWIITMVNVIIVMFRNFINITKKKTQ